METSADWLTAKWHELRRANNEILLSARKAASDDVADENDGGRGDDHDNGERDVDVVPLVGDCKVEADCGVDQADDEDDGAQDQLVDFNGFAVHPRALIADIVSVV